MKVRTGDSTRDLEDKWVFPLTLMVLGGLTILMIIPLGILPYWQLRRLAATHKWPSTTGTLLSVGVESYEKKRPGSDFDITLYRHQVTYE